MTRVPISGDYFGITVHAWCTTCGKDWHSKNGHAVGASHARRYNHTVHVEEARSYSYNDKREPGQKDTKSGEPSRPA